MSKSILALLTAAPLACHAQSTAVLDQLHFAQRHDREELGSLEPAIVDLLARLSPDEVDSVADYTSRLPALRASRPATAF